MNDTFDHEQLRAAVRTVHGSWDKGAVLEAAVLLANYTKATLERAEPQTLWEYETEWGVLPENRPPV